MRSALTVLLILCGGSVSAASADEPDAGAVHVLTRAPELLHFVAATYPLAAKEQHLEGEVLLQIDLDVDGGVSQAQVIQPAGNGFDEAALSAVNQFVFSPAEIDGKPSPVQLTYRYRFVLTPQAPLDAGPSPSNAPTGVLDGRVVERGTRAPLVGAQVFAAPTGRDGGEAPLAADSDADGRFSFPALEAGTYQVTVVANAHARFQTTESVEAGRATHVTYYVRRDIYSQYETVVTGEKEKKEVASTTLSQEEIRLVPGTLGDALKVVQNLPGVARVPYGLGFLVVRGSKPWDTRVYLDGAVLPQLFHFGGLTSVFNADLLQNIDFQPGNFNVDHGRAIGGLITADTREPSPELYHGYLNVNVIDASLLLEGPITPEWSVAVAARRSYIDTVLSQGLPLVFPNAGITFAVAPRYYDYQLVVDYHPRASADRVRIVGFGSNDKLTLLLDNPADIDPQARDSISSFVGFEILSGTWVHPFSDGKTTLTSDAYFGELQTSNAFGTDIGGGTDFRPLSLQERLSRSLAPGLTLEGGADIYAGPYTYYVSAPEFLNPEVIPDPIISRQLIRTSGRGTLFEPAVYTQAIWNPTSSTRIIPGIRADYDLTTHSAWVDPRIAAFQGVGPTTTLKAAVGLYHQPPDFLEGLLLPDYGNPDLKPEASQQYMVGVEQKLPWDSKLDVQVYYKWLFHQVEVSNATVIRDGQEVAERFDNGGTGRSFGVELLLRHDLTRNLFGWISYSLERTQVCSSDYSLTGVAPHCAPFGGSNWVPFPLDQPQHLVLVLSYKLPLDFIAGVRVQYASGNPYTPVQNAIYDADGDIYLPVPGQYLSQREPAFFQLDARIDKRFVFEKWMLTVYLDVQNVTNRSNPEFLLYNYNYTQQEYLSGLPIIPALGVKAEF